MAVIDNPALQQFVAEIGDELVLAQVLIQPQAGGYELRHVADRDKPDDSLRLVSAPGARELAQFTASGMFRPLKSAPNLQSGWRINVHNADGLAIVLNQLYPGAIADCFAAQSPAPPVTNFREFTQRQSGMYRITAMLSDEQAAAVTRAGCARQFCLKRRLWAVPGLEADPADEKSVIPCLEPCAVLLEFARKAMRIEQQEKLPINLSPADAETLCAAVEIALAHPDRSVKEADFGAADNPRRLQLVLEKLQSVLKLAGDAESE